MQIDDGKVVSFHYTLKEHEGEELESSEAGEPMVYLHGYQGLLRALQEGLAGQEEGSAITINVPAERAYGPHRPEGQMRVPLKRVRRQSSRPVKAGEQVRINTPEGERDAIVVKPGKFNVDVDTNHPLAGKNLVFDIKIVAVREAEAEELAHGHAHGPGGHQH